MNIEKPIIAGANKYVWKKNNNPNNANRIICPAVIFAKRRMVSANGLMKSPIISIGIIISHNPQ